ncbi:hypothetical protein QOT17_021598 [Balamuthia mandrillaris]
MEDPTTTAVPTNEEEHQQETGTCLRCGLPHSQWGNQPCRFHPGELKQKEEDHHLFSTTRTWSCCDAPIEQLGCQTKDTAAGGGHLGDPSSPSLPQVFHCKRCLKDIYSSKDRNCSFHNKTVKHKVPTLGYERHSPIPTKVELVAHWSCCKKATGWWPCQMLPRHEL